MATRAGAAPRVDPMEHAKRLNAAKERARLLKEQRSQASGGGGYSDGHYAAVGAPPAMPSMPVAPTSTMDSEWGPLGGAPVARRQPYGAAAPVAAPAPSSDASVPGYRGMMTFGPSGGSVTPYGAAPVSADPYAAAPAAVSRQAEADDTFYNMLRGGDSSTSTAPRGGGGRSRKPEWNSDVASSSAMDAPASRAPAVEDDGGHAVSSAKARVLRMRQELGAADVAPAAAKHYAGIVPERAIEPRRGGPVPAGGATWDDMPVGASKASAAFAVAEYDDAPIRSRPGPAAYAPDDRMDSDPPPAAAPKLSLLKSKLRTGSARALVSRDAPPAPAPAPAPPRYSDPVDDYVDTFSAPKRPAPAVQPRAVKPAPPPVDLYDDAPAVADPRGGDLGPENEEIELVECDGCGRKFKEEALSKHAVRRRLHCVARVSVPHDPARVQKVCKKVFQTKRKAYDSKAHALPEEAQKLASTTAAPTRGGARARGGPAKMSADDDAAAAKKTAWESKSRELRDAMRAAREYAQAIAAGVKPADIPAPRASAPDPSLVPCPTCGRSFSDKAAERHIPKCASIVAKPTMLRRGAGVAAGAVGAAKMQSSGGLGSTAGSSSSSTRGGGASGSMQSSFSSTASAMGGRAAPPAFRSFDDVPVGAAARGGGGVDRYGHAAAAAYGDTPSSARSTGGSRPPSGAPARGTAGGSNRSSGYGQPSYAAEVDRGTSASGAAYFSAADVLGRGSSSQRAPAGRESLGGGRTTSTTSAVVGRASVGGYSGAAGSSGARNAAAPRGGGIAYRM